MVPPSPAGRLLILVTAALLLAVAGASGAGPRAHELTADLLEHRDHRARARAARALAAHPLDEARDALLAGLDDPRVEVRLACLDSLARIGDATTLTPLREHEERNPVAQAERRRAVVLLEERFPGERAAIDWEAVSGVVAIGALVDDSGSSVDLSDELRRYLVCHLRMQPGLAVVDSPEELERLEARLWWHRLRPVLVTGRLHTLTASRLGDDVFWKAAGNVTVLDYQSRTIRAVLDNRAQVRAAPEVDAGPGPRSLAVEEAMRSAAESISRRLDEI